MPIRAVFQLFVSGPNFEDLFVLHLSVSGPFVDDFLYLALGPSSTTPSVVITLLSRSNGLLMC